MAGYFQKDHKQGYGVYKFENGDVYAGEWKDGLRHGYGVLNYQDSGAKFSGFWENDKRTGKAEVLCGAYKYVGTFALDLVSDASVANSAFYILNLNLL